MDMNDNVSMDATPALDRLEQLRSELDVINAKPVDRIARTPASEQPNTAATRALHRAAFGATFTTRCPR